MGTVSRWSWMVVAVLTFAPTALVGCAGQSDGGGAPVAAEEALLGSAPLPLEVIQALAHRDDLTDEELDAVYELHHYVRIGTGRRVHVSETFTLRGWLSWPHRGVLLLPGTFSTGSYYNLDVDGYRFQDTLAREGYFAFAVDYEGSGESTYPEDGYAVDHDYLVGSMRSIVRFARLLRLIPKIDVLGESNGASIATELCDDARAVRSCVLSSMFYVEGTDFYNAVFLDPGFVWFLTNQPNGYLDAGPEMYFNITSRMPPAVAAEILATQPGRFALGHVVDGLGPLPWFDPTRAAVPAIVIQGTEDNVATQHDADLLAADYGSVGGGHATVVRIEGAGMIPRTEAAPYNDIWTQHVLDFLASSPD